MRDKTKSPPLSQSPGRILVCEPTARWAVLLRRFGQRQIAEARSLALAEDLLTANASSFMAIYATSSENRAAQFITTIARWRQLFPQAAFAILCDEPNPDFDLGVREAGVQLVIHSLFELPLLIGMAQRHAEAVPPVELGWREAIEARLPWPNARSERT